MSETSDVPVIGNLAETPASSTSSGLTAKGPVIGGLSEIPAVRASSGPDSPQVASTTVREQYETWYRENHRLQSLPEDNPHRIEYMKQLQAWQEKLSALDSPSFKK